MTFNFTCSLKVKRDKNPNPLNILMHCPLDGYFLNPSELSYFLYEVCNFFLLKMKIYVSMFWLACLPYMSNVALLNCSVLVQIFKINLPSTPHPQLAVTQSILS